MPLTFLPFILLIVPILEIGVFVVVGDRIGALWTIALVLLTAVLGSILLRIEGFRTFAQIRAKMNSGEVPGRELVNGVMIIIAGVLLLTPGFLTDGLGFTLFVPFIRTLIWGFLASRFMMTKMDKKVDPGFSGRPNKSSNPNIVDLDPDEFYEDPNDQSPWYSNKDDKKRG